MAASRKVQSQKSKIGKRPKRSVPDARTILKRIKVNSTLTACLGRRFFVGEIMDDYRKLALAWTAAAVFFIDFFRTSDIPCVTR